MFISKEKGKPRRETLEIALYIGVIVFSLIVGVKALAVRMEISRLQEEKAALADAQERLQRLQAEKAELMAVKSQLEHLQQEKEQHFAFLHFLNDLELKNVLFQKVLKNNEEVTFFGEAVGIDALSSMSEAFKKSPFLATKRKTATFSLKDRERKIYQFSFSYK